jgi:predicted nucleotidyltransferase
MKDMKLWDRLMEHWVDALKLYPLDRIVCLVLQGSQNYGLADEESDVDSKLLLVPTLDEIIFNKKPVSTTHVRENEEHIDAKDIRLYWQCFRKGNINFVEVLFSEYYIVNPMYEDLWEEMRDMAEQIARVNPLAACKAIMGHIQEKYHAMEHRYPSRAHIIDKFDYDPKQLQHLVRMTDFLTEFIKEEYSYKDIMTLQPMIKEYREDYQKWLMDVKRGRAYDLEAARIIADSYLKTAEDALNRAKAMYDGIENGNISAFMDEVLAEMVKIGIRKELEEEEE